MGMDYFENPNDELAIALREKILYRNFQGYSIHAGADLYALGITSISQIGRVYAQNYKTEKEYFEALDKQIIPTHRGYHLTDDDLLRRFVIMKLMCDFELDFEIVEKKFTIDFHDYFSAGISNLKEFIDDQLVEVQNKKLIVTPSGRLFIRNIAMNFDGFIEKKLDEARYSKTI